MKELFNCEDQFHYHEFNFIWHFKRAQRLKKSEFIFIAVLAAFVAVVA